jgi:hypothetical protein
MLRVQLSSSTKMSRGDKMKGKTMTYKVTYAIDSLDPNPTVDIFDTFDEAQDWISDEVERRVDHIVQHSALPIREDELDEIREIELSLVSIEEV